MDQRGREYEFLEGHAEDVAPRLLGCTLTRWFGNIKTVVRIVETEAYHQSDAASHSYNGITPRNKIMFGEAGKLYVYFTYGMHYCCNIVTGHIGEGSAVLIRAVEPINSTSILEDNRPNVSKIELTNGPAKLCQALAIDKNFNGHDLRHRPLQLDLIKLSTNERVVSTNRIGIRKEQQKLWRFYISTSDYVSKR